MQVPKHCAFQIFPWSTPPLSTVHQLGVVVRILASLTAFSIMLCALSLVACVPHQRKTCLSSKAPSQLSSADYERHSPLVNRAIHGPDHVLHRQLVGQQDAHLGRLGSKHPFVPAAWKLLDSLSKLDIRGKQWKK